MFDFSILFINNYEFNSSIYLISLFLNIIKYTFILTNNLFKNLFHL